MTEEEIKQNLEENERTTMNCVCDTLSSYGERIRLYLADFIASLCNVEKEKMFSTCNNLDVAQARWLFWYAYRYMTNENYDSIARKTGTKRKFTVGSIGYCISKMSMMVESEPIWVKRWTIIKRVIKAILDNGSLTTDKLPTTITLKVVPPSGVDVKLQLIQ